MPNESPEYKYLCNLVELAKSQTDNEVIMLPHRCCLAIILGCCYKMKKMSEISSLWFLLSQYFLKKYDDIKTHVDENLCKLASRFLSRKKREFIEYEMLYFMKEINKLSDEHVTELLVKVDNYLSKIKNLKNYI